MPHLTDAEYLAEHYRREHERNARSHGHLIAGEVYADRVLQFRPTDPTDPTERGLAELVVEEDPDWHHQSRVLLRCRFHGQIAEGLVERLAAMIAHPSANSPHVWVRTPNPNYRADE